MSPHQWMKSGHTYGGTRRRSRSIIRTAIAAEHRLRPAMGVLIPPGELPKTS